jgi:cation:H+ antiporter
MSGNVFWLLFFLCLVVIFLAGRQLSIFGDRLGDETGLGGSWVGIAILSTVTSLPELMTGISSVSLAMTPEIAVGDVFGSCAFNIGLLVLVHLVTRRETPLFAQIGDRHVLPAAFGVMMMGIVTLELMSRQLGLSGSLFGVGPFVPVVVGLYVIGIRMVFRAASDRAAADDGTAPRAPGVQRSTLIGLVVSALFVIAGGTALPFIGSQIAALMGWNESFVGTMLIATATSAPEIAVTLAAARMGALDLAVGNVFGSNMFNIVILALDDIFYHRGPLLADVSLAHAASAVTAMVMTGMAIAAMSYRRASGASLAIISLDIGLVLLFVGNAVLVFNLGH